jgi:alpha-amylase
MMLPSEAIAELDDPLYEIPVNEYGTTWAGEGGMEFFLGNSAQQGLFRLMHHAYSKARLTGDPRLIELARWLLQSDNLHLIQWFGRSGPAAEVSAYFTPDEWWELGPNGIIREQQRVYLNFIRALDQFVG